MFKEYIWNNCLFELGQQFVSLIIVAEKTKTLFILLWN